MQVLNCLKTLRSGVKMKYEIPNMEIVMFEADEVIAASADYFGVDFEDLI